MSVLGLDGRKWPAVSQDALPQHHEPVDEATILPLLKRLRHSEFKDVSNSKVVHLIPPVGRSFPPIEPADIQQADVQQDASPSPKSRLSITGRVVIALSLVALLATGAVIFLELGADHPASAASAESREATGISGMDGTPEMKHAATSRPETTTVGETQPSSAISGPATAQSGTGYAERVGATRMKPVQPRSQAALMFSPPLLNLNGSTIPDVLAPEPMVRVPHRKAGTKKPVRHHQTNHATHQTESAAVKPQGPPPQETSPQETSPQELATQETPPQPQEATPPAETQANAVKPTKKVPLQAALDDLFGTDSNNINHVSNNVAPAASSY